jgi:hypothetical protein
VRSHERFSRPVRPIRAWPENTNGAHPVRPELKFHMIAARKKTMIMTIIYTRTPPGSAQRGGPPRGGPKVQQRSTRAPTRRSEGPTKVHMKVPDPAARRPEGPRQGPAARRPKVHDTTSCANFRVNDNHYHYHYHYRYHYSRFTI